MKIMSSTLATAPKEPICKNRQVYQASELIKTTSTIESFKYQKYSLKGIGYNLNLHETNSGFKKTMIF